MQGVKARGPACHAHPGHLRTAARHGCCVCLAGWQVRHLGDLYETGTNNDLTENRRRDQRLKMLAAIPETQMVVFGPQTVKHTITVFTDMDCAYCRKLHSQISDYNKLGIKVRYIAYPRSGPNTASWSKAEQVWCAADRKTALTEAKLGKSLPGKICPDNPVAKEYELGQKFNLQGTPTLILGNGEMVLGLSVAAGSGPGTQRRRSLTQRSSRSRLPGLPSHSLASAGAAIFSASTGHFLASSAFRALKDSWPAGSSSSEKMASTGHSGSHRVQSMHSSGSITRKFGPTWKQSTGHTSTQSVYLHLMQLSVTTKVIGYPRHR